MWKPSGRPAAAKLAAISSISPTKRHALRALLRTAASERAGSSGWEILHSARRAASTPSAAANARAAMRSAACPLFQPAYAALRAEAAPGGPSSAIASSGPSAKSAATRAAPSPAR